jgi:sulfur carrier protein
LADLPPHQLRPHSLEHDMRETASSKCIHVNGKVESLAIDTLAALLAEKEIDPGQRGIAVALNGSVVPRGAWAETPIRPGDSVEIVRARQGG